jgi:glutamate racemase
MKHRLGIIDWGIGGVSIYKLVKAKIDVPVTYFSDTGVTPYGKMSRNELATRLDNVVDLLITRGVTHLVIGCNAGSTAIRFLKDHNIPIEGVNQTAIVSTAKLKPTRLGLVGGRRTVVSGIYRRAFAERRIDVTQRIAQPLSGLIESGDVSSDRVRESARHILSPLKNCSHILLACTHYPAITPLLAEFVSPKTKFIDPAAALLPTIERWNLDGGSGNDEFLTTGDASGMRRAAKAAFGVDIKGAKHVAAESI